VVHGGAGRGQKERSPSNARTVGESATPVRLHKGVVPTVQKGLKPHGGLGGLGTPGARHRLPTSSSPGAQRPRGPPQRSFPSCPAAVPVPPEAEGK
jgi:hypothetical protein